MALSSSSEVSPTVGVVWRGFHALLCLWWCLTDPGHIRAKPDVPTCHLKGLAEAVYSQRVRMQGTRASPGLMLSLCIGSLTLIPPNTQLHPIAPTLAAPQAPTRPIGASSLWKAWTSQPVTPEAASIAPWGQGAQMAPISVPRLS